MPLIFIWSLVTIANAAPSSSRDIDQWLDLAVQNSLQVQIQSYKVEETRSLGSSQTAWSNPNVILEAQRGDDNTASPIDKQQFYIVQPLTSPWRTVLKGRIAKSSVDIENHHLEDQRLTTRVQVLDLIFRFNIAKEKIKRVDNHVKRIELLNSYLRSRKFVSAQKQSEVFIVENKIRVLRKQLDDLNVLAKNLWLQLNIYLQLQRPEDLRAYWVNQTLELPKQELLQKTLSQNHDLELSQFEIEKSQSELSYEKNQRLPELALAGGAAKGVHGNPEDNYTIGLQVQVPIFNINRHKLRASQWALRQSQTKKELLIQQLKRDFQTTYDQYELSKDLIKKFPLQKLPQMENTMNKMAEQFKRGQVDLMTFVEADLSHDLLIDETLQIQMTYIQSLSQMSMLVGEMIPLKGIIHEINL